MNLIELHKEELHEEFDKNGFSLFLVGGSLRDAFIGKESTDYDYATNAMPEDTKKILAKFGKPYLVGQEYGTIGIIVDGIKIEVTTFRDEVYPSDSRKPKVVFGSSLIKDLSRRDFTMNAMAFDPFTSEFVDPFNGASDLSNKLIRCVGNDVDRFNEDPLRMIRAVRFACQLGFNPKIKIKNPERLQIVSKERVRDELVKILLSDRPTRGIKLLCSFGLMEYIIPEVLALKNIEQGKNHIKDVFEHSLLVLKKGCSYDFGNDNLIFRLSCLLHDIAKPDTKSVDKSGVHFYSHQYVGALKAEQILKRLRFDNETIARVCLLVSLHMNPIMLQKNYDKGTLDDRMIRRLIRKAGEEDILLLIGLVKCDLKSSNSPRNEFLSDLRKRIKRCLADKPCDIKSPLNGNEIMEMFSLKPSGMVGNIKSHLIDLVVDGVLDANDKEKAIKEAQKFVIYTCANIGGA